jgi:uncharacterized protein (DUF952 family)
MLIYKIFRPAELAELLEHRTTAGAPVDVADGYVHFSTGAQVEETLNKHFAAEADLTLLAVETDTLGEALKWERSRGDALFPHLYRDLRLEDVLWQRPLPFDAASQTFEPVWT